MALSLYECSIPVLLRGLTTLSSLLDKAAAYAAAKKFDPIVLLQARLYPDMHPLSRQVQIVCDTAKGAGARLAGVEIPKHEDNEVTLADLKQRIAKTVDFLSTVTAEKMQDAEARSIEIKTPNRTLKFTARAYLTDFVLPNFYFHETAAYAILRHNGVELGKGDFLGAIQ